MARKSDAGNTERRPYIRFMILPAQRAAIEELVEAGVVVSVADGIRKGIDLLIEKENSLI